MMVTTKTIFKRRSRPSFYETLPEKFPC